MKILSIDWDYFFPPSECYDWSHKECLFFFETIWQSRATAKNIFTQEEAIETYRPKIRRNFWSLVSNNPPLLVHDSHLALYDLTPQGSQIVSLDAHHDCGYHNTQLNCGSWAKYGISEGRISHFRLHYPKWRKKSREESDLQPHEIRYDHPQPSEYDMVFVCRSSCWTPPWYDHRWISFLDRSHLKPEFLDPRVSQKRCPSLEKAKRIRAEVRNRRRRLERIFTKRKGRVC